MEKKTVRRRIFVSNALMVLVTLVLFLGINLLVIKVYSESIEDELRESAAQVVDMDGVDELLESFTIHRDEFLLLFVADGILCIAVLLIVSQLFTRNLTEHMMEPLEALAAGTRRIREHDLTQKVEYSGESEFEQVCAAFNDMQEAILEEQEKNRKYEQARTEMIAGISHDLRTPLTAIRGMLKGLLDGVASGPEQRQKFLESAYRRTGDMDLLLNQLFYISKLETGNMPISLQDIEISGFLSNYVKGKRDFASTDDIEIQLDTKGILADVAIDPEQLQRILDNLFENSRKYGEKSPLLLQLTLKKTPNGVCICFRDNGVGLPEEKLPHIFEEFYRGDESRNKKEGSGLGLYIVKCLMEAMGGSVRAENADGLAVYLELPVSGQKGKETDGRQETNFDCGR